jgi:hypothetical protein
MHLTNYSINKYSEDFIFNSSAEDANKGHKRSIKSVFDQIRRNKGKRAVSILWSKIKRMIIKTFCAA